MKISNVIFPDVSKYTLKDWIAYLILVIIIGVLEFAILFWIESL